MQRIFCLNKEIKNNEKYRHEYKYEIDFRQYEMLKIMLPRIMEFDSHTREDGSYLIRSLYFDDFDNSCYYDNENGTDPREKYRIRLYNGSTDVIKLELKRKEHGKTLKKSCSLTKGQVERIINGESVPWDDEMHPLLKKLYVLQNTKGMKPKVIVEYDRIPYVCENGNVRVTLDLNIRTTAEIMTFLDKKTNCRLIMPKGKNLLEVKFDELLPDYIYQTMQLNHLQQTTFSKYYLCRKFGGITL